MKVYKKTESNKQYHSDKEYISSSGLRMYLKSPLHYKHYVEHGEESNPAFVMGSLYHTAILEPEKLKLEYIRTIHRPDQSKGMTAKTNKEWRSGLEARGRHVVDEMTWETVQAMKKKLSESDDLVRLIDKGMNEHSYYIDGFEGVKVKTRPDKVTKHAVIDFKTTDNASVEGFTRTIFKYGYHIQAALYLDVLKQFESQDRQFVFVVQEKKEPYAYQLFRLDEEVIEYGRWKYLDLIEKHKKCLEEDKWGGYEQFNEESSKGVTTIKLPGWINY